MFPCTHNRMAEQIKMALKSGISKYGQFRIGIHRPSFKIKNLREKDHTTTIGKLENNQAILNNINFPDEDIDEQDADWIFEIPNAFPFRGTTYITKSWADEKSSNPALIGLPEQPAISLISSLNRAVENGKLRDVSLKTFLEIMPDSLLLALATTSTDECDLMQLAEMSCEFIFDKDTARPAGLQYLMRDDKKPTAKIINRDLFEALANNYYLPDDYKSAMVLAPGVQGNSEIVGEWTVNDSHIFEYLRRNSYIPWGHFAANMANDSVRYRIETLSLEDISGLRHLYYQRTYLRIAEQLDISINKSKEVVPVEELENLRIQISKEITTRSNQHSLFFNGSLWGWNFGFDYAPSRYRLHASHQQIHQQFAMIPGEVPLAPAILQKTQNAPLSMSTYSCGDLISSFIDEYRRQTGMDFFDNYIQAIRTNERMDGRKDRENNLVVFADNNVMIFVPKAQTSQWELQLMTLQPVGNILEASTSMRKSIDIGILIAVKVLSALGARMITSIEFSKRFNSTEKNQRLLYAFMPKLPESPGAFSEAQLRWINGHYPEDFAAACRSKLVEVDSAGI